MGLYHCDARLGYPRCMSRLLLLALPLLLLPSCSPSVGDGCAVVCEKNALCQPGSDEALCTSTCKELSADDEAYSEAIVRQAECYEENASYYDDPKGVCLAIQGGACNTIRQ
jgi:hypothetical protein